MLEGKRADEETSMLDNVAMFLEQRGLVNEFVATLDDEDAALFEERFEWSGRDRFAEAEEMFGDVDRDETDLSGEE